MTERRKRIAEGATVEELQRFLLKLTGQLRTLAPPAHVVKDLDQIEARVAEMKERGDAKAVLASQHPH
jgi:hypothetical protein